jgi:sugar phosphate isomerase/epimerase
MGFGPLEKLKASELKKIIKGEGFTCISCHYGFNELKEHSQERIAYAKELGLEQMIISSYGLPKDATLSDWQRAAEETNKLGEQSKKAGIQMGFHNHNNEFEKLEGELIYDVLLKQLDPSLVKMQFQVWVISIGYKAADYFRKYPGRFISAHLYDWSGSGEEMVALGKGKVDWKEFFDAAKVGGVKNYFVEMDVDLKASADFLKRF